jgi:signal-transduction protein with cAMP-binding, CBS, and nucleotidyltransferase domain
MASSAASAALGTFRRLVASSRATWAPLSTLRPASTAATASQALDSGTEQAAPDVSIERSTIADILARKGVGNDGSWLWCTTEDSVFDAVKSMTSHNVGALLVLKPSSGPTLDGGIAGIVTERDYLRKIIVQGRSSKSTRVGEIMTEENKLITVSPNTKVLKAMELMTENRIRHIPVIENQKMKGMVSIGDVVKAVVMEHREEVQRLSEFIQGSY